MRFKELTKEDKDFFKKTYLDKSLTWDDRLNVLMEFANKKSKRTIQNWIAKLGLTEPTEVESPELKKAKSRQFNKKKKKFIITWAQNNTPVHERFWLNMQAYAKHINADIHVIAGRYKNPTSIFSDARKASDVWHHLVKDNLDAARHDIHRYLSIMSDIKLKLWGL